ncbi:hypothetical protein LWC33_21360 [Pseudonocardia sp. RS11V-5]|uniref:hypothetical protein n=1 Tax=Pseudonocardia terrae TaxID=2905831 RepID=UPI001E505506|nr:hypothetical protein [Pseudonocardia terrae]MCE3553992.1 hypothetical protein [Pseudonocardia terrae]
MTGFRPPSVAGVSGGVGTTTLALALHGRDSGTGAGIEADIVVCRSSAESLDRAVRIADLFDPTAVPPVLAVSVDGAERRHPERLDELGPGWVAVVLVPHVGRWRGIADPYREAAGLLGTPRDRLPRALRPYLDAITRLARAVADSGRLGGPAPAARPLAPRPSTLGAFPRSDASAPLLPDLTPARPTALGPAPVAFRAGLSASLGPDRVPARPGSLPVGPDPTPAALGPEPAPLRPGPAPVTVPPEPEPSRPEAPLTTYRPFVPVGADGPLTSIALPRSLSEPPHARPSPPPYVDPACTSDTEGNGRTPADPSAALELDGPLNTGPTDSAAADLVALGTATARAPAATHPDLRPVRGIRILDVASPVDVGRSR